MEGSMGTIFFDVAEHGKRYMQCYPMDALIRFPKSSDKGALYAIKIDDFPGANKSLYHKVTLFSLDYLNSFISD